jgi:hypothetical protein
MVILLLLLLLLLLFQPLFPVLRRAYKIILRVQSKRDINSSLKGSIRGWAVCRNYRCRRDEICQNFLLEFSMDIALTVANALFEGRCLLLFLSAVLLSCQPIHKCVTL